MKPKNKCSWAEVDLGIIRKNLAEYQSAIGQAMQIMAVIKANVYGHDDIEIGKVLCESGVRNFGSTPNLVEIGLYRILPVWAFIPRFP